MAALFTNLGTNMMLWSLKFDSARSKPVLKITTEYVTTYTASRREQSLIATSRRWVQEGGYLKKWARPNRMQDPKIRKQLIKKEEMTTPTNEWENFI